MVFTTFWNLLQLRYYLECFSLLFPQVCILYHFVQRFFSYECPSQLIVPDAHDVHSTQLKQSQFIQAKSRAFDNNWPWSSLCQSSALLLPMWRISSAQIRSSAILPRMTLSFTLVSKTGNLIAIITYAISNRKLNMVIFPRRSSKRKLVTPFVSFSFILT